MDLHDLPGISTALAEPPVHPDHGPLDDVRRRSLHGRVYGAALGVLAALEVARVDLGQVQAPSENRGYELLFAGTLARFVHVLLHAGIAGEVEIDVLLGGGAADFKLPGETEGRHPVDQAEVDGFRRAPLFRRDVFTGHFENLRRRGAVDVLAAAERAQQSLVAGQVSHDPQLDLGIVRRQQTVTLRRDEGLANPSPLGGPHGNVLQIGVRRRQPPGGCHGLMVGGVDPARARIDLQRQLVGIGGLEFGHPPVFQNQLRHLVALAGQILKDPFRCGRLSLGRLDVAGYLEAVEENVLQLFRRIQVEGDAAGFVVRGRYEFCDGLGQFPTLRVQHFRVDQYAPVFHFLKHRNQRLFDLRVERFEIRCFLKLRPERAVQAQRDVRVLGGVRPGGVQVHFVEADLFGALAGNLFVLGGLHVEVTGRDRVHVVAGGGGVEDEGFEHGIVGHSAQFDTVVLKNMSVVLEMVADLLRVALEPRLEALEHVIPG